MKNPHHHKTLHNFLQCVAPALIILLPESAKAGEIYFNLLSLPNSKSIGMGNSEFVAKDAEDAPIPTNPGKIADQSNTSNTTPPAPLPVMGPVIEQAPDDTKAAAQQDPTDRNRKLKRTNAYLEIAYQVLNAADMVQTTSCLSKHTCVENNPILGKRPSTGTVVGFKIASALIHYTVYRSIINHPRKVRTFEYISIAIQAGAVISNLRVVF